jgi:Lysylphosphatidylglycerol synthase TM region
MKKFHTFSIVLGSALLLILIWSIGIKVLWHDMVLLGWGLVPLVLIEGVAELFHTVAWRHCLSGPHRFLSFFQIFRIRMAGGAINYLTPTAALGGEVTKGALLSLGHRGPEAATGVIIDKLAYASAQLLFVVTGSVIILWGIDLPEDVWAAMLSCSGLLGAGILGFLVVQKHGKLGAVVRWMTARKLGGKALSKATQPINEVDHALRLFYKKHPWDLSLSMFWHTVGMACGIVQSWYFLYLLIEKPSFLMAAGIWFLGSWFDLLSFAVPFNIGILEASRVLVFKILGFHYALGLVYGVMLRLEQLFWAGIGLLFYATLLAKKRRRRF